MKNLSRLLVLFLLVIAGPRSSWGQDYDGVAYDEIVSNLETQSSYPDTKVSFGLSSGSFSNSAYELEGQMYAFAFQLVKPQEWLVGFDVPYLSGAAVGVASEELGNPLFRSRFNVWQISEGYSLWLPLSLRVGQKGRSYRIASHHDTYRAGLEIEYREGTATTSVGGGYQLRTMEEDRRVNVGDIVDAKGSVRFSITEALAFRTQVEWYRAFPTEIQGQGIVKTIDWAGVSPGLSYQLVSGLNFMTEVVFPVYQTGTPYQTDLAFAEVYYPQTSFVTWNWGMGASF